MQNPKRFSDVVPVSPKNNKYILLQTQKTLQQMYNDLDKHIREQLEELAKSNSSHIHPASFPHIYSSGEYITEIFDLNSWFSAPEQIANGIIPTTLPRTHAAVIALDSKQYEKERLQEELNRIEATLLDFDTLSDAEQKDRVEDYYKKSHYKEILSSNKGFNRNVDRMQKLDKRIDAMEAKKSVDPNANIIARKTNEVLEDMAANKMAELRGRKIRSDAEQRVVMLSHALKIKKYQKKAAKLEAKKDAALAVGKTAKATKLDAKIDKVQDKIDKPISVWSSKMIILKESAKDLFRTKRKYQDYRPWEVRRAEALQEKVNKSL